jgi:large subunit ribosomal protein L31e
MADLERIYIVPFGKAYNGSRSVRSRKAIKLLREFMCRHMKSEPEEVAISTGVNELIWARGMQKPPRKIKVRALKKDGRTLVMLMEEKAEEVAKTVVQKGGEKGKKEEKEKPAEKATPAPEKKEAPKPAPAPKPMHHIQHMAKD